MVTLTRLNGDTSWLIVFGSGYRLVVDPWLHDSAQVDGHALFSAQRRVEGASVGRLADVGWDGVVFSHPFSDHMHPRTIADALPLEGAVYAATAACRRALERIGVCTAITTLEGKGEGEGAGAVQIAPGVSARFLPARERRLSPAWTPLHAALLLEAPDAAILYSPHGIGPDSLPPPPPAFGFGSEPPKPLILLSALDAQSLPLLGPVALGFSNTRALLPAWPFTHILPTHDEHKSASGLVALLIRRVPTSPQDAQRIIDSDPACTHKPRILSLRSGEHVTL